jgi:ribosome-binding factor A
MKHRLERVNEIVKRELSEIINRELAFNPGVLVTVTGVDITPNLRQCTVYVSVVGDEAQKPRVLDTLEHHRATLQRELSKRVILKYTPHLSFKLDESVERGTRIIDILQDLDLEDE